ncbi:MAG: hypothetical protein CMJ20_01735 [Phycisphaeraceae bacterium]|nr:hypothetical protein [Phycisphaeraceae bacterium]|tara:strand:+ start:17834 stop:18118 length:285 start_codon:yes stop_codon:yes gene_type:complete
MAAAAKQGSTTSGHGGFHPTVVVGGNGQFKIYGSPIATTGHAIAPHVKPKSPPHGSVVLGSSKMLVYGQPVVLVGDGTACGDTVVSGEPRFNVG